MKPTLVLLLFAACVSPESSSLDEASTLPPVSHVIVVAMENHDAVQIYGNADAPYINSLLSIGAHATSFVDELPASVPSEPHYIWMEAGTNTFSDHSFTTDFPPTWFSNSTSSSAHLVAQLRAADDSWMSYQEDLNWLTGACPVNDWWWYAAKHDPFVFFRDVSGASPSTSNAYCASHHKPYSSLAADLSSDTLARYVFITPNLCHDMHGALFCPDSNNVRAGDTWLKSQLPSLLTYADTHDAVVFLVWD
ncbi:MAG TPA: alkaline phosphatase family protein, partial [Kofleriaceae bacterium]|nr:alkaline phosphatase family protein [Kofleriaceae bacterium]